MVAPVLLSSVKGVGSGVQLLTALPPLVSLGGSCPLMTSPGQEAVCLCCQRRFLMALYFGFCFSLCNRERDGFNVMGFSQQLASEQTDSELGFNEFLPALLHPQRPLG